MLNQRGQAPRAPALARLQKVIPARQPTGQIDDYRQPLILAAGTTHDAMAVFSAVPLQ